MKYFVLVLILVTVTGLLIVNSLQAPAPQEDSATETVATIDDVSTAKSSQAGSQSAEPSVNPAAPASSAVTTSEANQKPKPLPPLQSKDLIIGSGKQVKVGSKVAFNIIIKLKDGRIISNTYKEGRPWEGVVGNGSLLSGVDQGIRGMFQGSKRALWIPPHLAFGDYGVKPQVPPNAHLYAEVEIVSIF